MHGYWLLFLLLILPLYTLEDMYIITTEDAVRFVHHVQLVSDFMFLRLFDIMKSSRGAEEGVSPGR